MSRSLYRCRGHGAGREEDTEREKKTDNEGELIVSFASNSILQSDVPASVIAKSWHYKPQGEVILVGKVSASVPLPAETIPH